MEFSNCCIESWSRGTAPGTPAGWLAAAWREAATTGGPTAVLVRRDGVLVVSWVNDALGELLGRDVGDLAGRALRELVDAADAGMDGVAGPMAPELVALLPAGGPTGGAAPSPDGRPESQPTPAPEGNVLIGWARLAHQLARSGGGTGVAALRRPDGGNARVRLAVRAVDVPARSGASYEPGREDRSAVPGPRSDTTGAPGGRPGGDPTPSVPLPGTVGELPPTPEPPCWLLVVEPASDAVAEAEAALTVAEHRFAALASCAPVGIFASEAGLRLGYVNDHFVKLTGVDAPRLLGNAWLDLVHRDDLPAVYTAVQTVLGGTPVELAVRLSGLGGVQRWLQLRLAPTTTPARAAGFIGTAEDVTARRSWEEHLTYQAHHDPLTGLVNRRRLLEVLTDQLSGRRGRDREFAVLFLDLDGFKEVNDLHGHAAGDRALIEVARRMMKVARESDVIARISGDEFVVVLRNIANEGEAEAAARRHLAALADPVRIGPAEVRLSASIGVAMPAGFDTPDSLLRAADRVMYEAKAAGQGLYRLAPVGPAREGR